MTQDNTESSVFDRATTYDLGAIDIHIAEIDGRYWISTSPRLQDGEAYEGRSHLGEDIYEAIRQHEGWSTEL